MTTTRSAVLAYIEEHIAQYGFSPNLREIAAACGGLSTSTVARHITALGEEEAITYTPGIARSITLGRRAPMVEDLRSAVGAMERGQDALPGLRALLKRLEG